MKYISCSTCVRLFLLALGVLLFFPAMGKESFRHEIDSLKDVLAKHTDPQITIPVAFRVATLYGQSPEVVSLLTRNYQDAVRIDSIQATYASLSALARYYYNGGVRDSLFYWAGIIDSMAKARDEYPDALFNAKSYISQNMLWGKDYESALNYATDLYKLASSRKNTYGLIRCSETIGLIYRGVRRDKEAIEFFQQGMDLLQANDGSVETQLRLCIEMAEPCLRVGSFQQIETFLNTYKQLIDRQEQINKEQGEVVPVDRERWFLYCFYTDFYLRKNNMEKAKEAQEMTRRYYGNQYSKDDVVINIDLYMQARYHNQAGDYLLALHLINELLQMESIQEDFQLKADILKNMGNLKGALEAYDSQFEMAMKGNNDAFFRQINQLRTLHDVNYKETQDHELQVANERVALQQRRLYVFVVVIFILLALLYVLSRYIRRVQKLRVELQHDKNLLEESEKNLRLETNKIEEANRMKSAFVANMSHEIRTPLNAIVGFSSLLTDSSSSPEEREEYAMIIQNNTELMLNLVNDVLDLSRMEAGDMYFNKKRYLLADCCKKALDSIRTRVPEGVRLTFTPDPEPVMVCTDSLRLQQLLTNLLTNAIKFTEEGEINLAFKLETDRRQVCIAVTDTGCGIPLDKQSAVFNRFEKLNDHKQGTGLGLSICRTIADHLEGSIMIDPGYTTGARFVFYHPVVP